MPELTTDFQSLPEEYQRLIRLARVKTKALSRHYNCWWEASRARSSILLVFHPTKPNASNTASSNWIARAKNTKSDVATRHNTVMDLQQHGKQAGQ